MQRSFQYNNAKIFYSVQGQGHPVVLLHGFGEDSTVWQKQLPALANYQVIIPDLPGSGASEMLTKADGEQIGIEDYAQCVYALLQHEQINNIVLLGHSMGGYITLAFAQLYSENLRGFGLLHSTAFADSDEKKASRKKGIQLIREYGGYSFLKNTIPNLFAEPFKKNAPGEVAGLIEKGRQFADEALVQYYEAMIARPDRTTVLKESNVPVLFVIGTDDVAAAFNDLLQQVHLPATSHVHVLNNTGHMGMWETTEEFDKHVADFLATIKW